MLTHRGGVVVETQEGRGDNLGRQGLTRTPEAKYKWWVCRKKIELAYRNARDERITIPTSWTHNPSMIFGGAGGRLNSHLPRSVALQLEARL